MEALLTSLGVVAVAEIGDRTQLLTFLLAYRFRRPWPILAGILVATLANHAVAALVGEWVGGLLSADVLRWVLGVSFGATVIAFVLAEIGDKTQIATVALAARFELLVPVVLGTTAGMLLANAPAVMVGHFAAFRLNLGWARYVAAAIFAVEAVLTLAGHGIGVLS